MAIDSTDLKKHFEENAPQSDFVPCAHYDSDSDAVTFYFSNEPDYRKRLNTRVTIYLSDATHELVGCRIKGVRRVLEDIGWFDVSIKHGRARLDILFLPLHEAFADDEDARQFYRKLGDMARRFQVEIEFDGAEPAACG